MSIEIPLTQNKVARIDAADWELVRGRKWNAMFAGNSWYAATKVRRADGQWRLLLMHRLLLGLTDRNVVTDHIDGDGLNNSRSNLRACTHGENMRNARLNVNNTSGLKGASFKRQTGRWLAVINLNGKQRHLGYYPSKEEAHAAYCKAATELHGQFANFGGPA